MYLADVDACILLSKCMPVPELGDDGNRVETSVLGKRRRNDFERIRICLEAIRFHALERIRVLGEQPRDVDLGRTTTSNERTRGR